MNQTEHYLTLLLLAFLGVVSGIGWMRYNRYILEIDNSRYVMTGFMQIQNTDGKTLYTPVYEKR